MPTFGQLLLLGVGLEARVGLANRDVVDDVFSPPEVQPVPPVCTHHAMFLSRSAHGISPVTVREGEILLWNGAYEMEVVKADSTDGDAEVTWALGATLPPTRPAPAWRLLHAVPEWERAKEYKKGTWTVTCPCECEVCIVFYPVFARSSREVRNCVLRIRICSFGNLSRSSREFHVNIYISFIFHFISFSGGMALLAARPPSGRGRPEAIPPGRAHQCPCTAGHGHGHRHGHGRPRVLRHALECGRRPAR